MTEEMQCRLLSCNSFTEFTAMFFGLGLRDKLSVFTEEVWIEKGTNFYRIRQIEEGHDPNDPKEWGPIPKDKAKKAGRFNAKGESVLYVASDPAFLEREVRLSEGEDYYLAKYVCKKSFKVGSFLGVHNQVNTLLHKIAMAVSCSDDLTDSENKLMDEYYEWAKNKNLYDISLDQLASLYIYRQLPNLYETTNKLSQLVLKKNDCGIRYSSVFAPLELSGADVLVTFSGLTFGNYVLTPKGCENLEMVSVESKKCGKITDLTIMIEVNAEEEKKQYKR